MKQQMLEAEVKELNVRIEALKAERDYWNAAYHAVRPLGNPTYRSDTADLMDKPGKGVMPDDVYLMSCLRTTDMYTPLEMEWLCADAADRIEALKAELKAVKEAYGDIEQYARKHCAEVGVLTADNALLRDALERVVGEYDLQMYGPAISSIDVARTALNHRKEVMPDDQTSNSTHTRPDIGPGDQAVAGAADYAALRQDIRNMVKLYEIYGEEVSLAVDPESAGSALSYLDIYEGRNWPSPRILVENNSIVLTWEIGNWKLYQYCDDEPQKIFRWVGTPVAGADGRR